MYLITDFFPFFISIHYHSAIFYYPLPQYVFFNITSDPFVSLNHIFVNIKGRCKEIYLYQEHNKEQLIV